MSLVLFLDYFTMARLTTSSQKWQYRNYVVQLTSQPVVYWANARASDSPSAEQVVYAGEFLVMFHHSCDDQAI